MFQKLKLFFELFQKGKQVKDKNFWLQSQSTVLPVLVSLFLLSMELGKAYGFDLQINQETLYTVAGLFYFGVNTVILFITNKRIGLPQKSSREAQQAVPNPSATGDDQEQPIVPSIPVSRFDEDTLARANEWLQRQRLDDKPGGVFYSP